MTEEEAKTKWCPCARVAAATTEAEPYTLIRNTPAFNRIQTPAEGRKPVGSECIASACMAWRTRTIRTHVNHVNRDGTSAVATQPEDIVTLDGFCGLAGQP